MESYANTSCDEHPHLYVLFYCDDCKVLVCGDCITDKHNRHGISKLDKTAQRKRNELSEIIGNGKEDILSDLTFRQKQVIELLDERSEQVKMVDDKMCDRAEKMKRYIDNLRNSQIDIFRNAVNIQNNNIKEKEKHIVKIKEEINKLSNKTSQVNEMTDVEIIRLQGSLKQRLAEIKSSNINTSESMPSFICDDRFEDSLKIAFGCVESEQETASDFQHADDDGFVEVSLTYQIPYSNTSAHLRGLRKIEFIGEDSGWLLKQDGWLFYAGSIRGNRCKLVRQNVDEFAVTKQGDALITTEIDHLNVLKVFADGASVIWSNFYPFRPYHLCTTQNDDVIICMSQNVGLQGSKHTTVKFDKVGRKVMELFPEERDIKVSEIAENKNGNLCIAAFQKHGICASVLYICDPKGVILSSFDGILGPNPQHNFNISGFCCDIKGRLIVADDKNNIIYLLDDHGKFLEFIVREKPEINGPTCVAIDKKDRLWISVYHNLYVYTNWEPKV